MLPLGTGAPVYLDIQQWNAVLAALAEAPYRVSAPLIQAILGQLQHPLPPSLSPAAESKAPPPDPPDPEPPAPAARPRRASVAANHGDAADVSH